MPSDVVGDLLPLAVGVALSPVPIVAVILLLSTPRARVAGGSFAIGWTVGLILVSGVMTLVAAGASSGDGAASTAVGWVKLVIGAFALWLGVRRWRTRPGPDEEATPPRWMAGIDTMAVGRAGVLGAALAGINPKNFALAVAAAASIGDADLNTSGTVAACAVDRRSETGRERLVDDRRMRGRW